MSCLARSLIITGDRQLHHDFGDYEQEARDADFQRNAIEEIQRFRRIDEWLPSFQNLYTVTALECLEVLMQNRVTPRRLADFIVYTRPGNSDPVRLKAFECLVELGLFTEPAVMQYYFDSLASEPSPYMREWFWRILGHGLGRMALIEPQVDAPAPSLGLVIEGDTNDARQAALARTQTIQGAVAALKARADNIQELKDALIDALRSPEIGLEDFQNLLTVCKTLYDPMDGLTVSLKLPPYWRVEHVGNGKLVFQSTGRYRTAPVRKLDLKRPRPTVADDPQSATPHPKRRRISTGEPGLPLLQTNGIPHVSHVSPSPPAVSEAAPIVVSVVVPAAVPAVTPVAVPAAVPAEAPVAVPSTVQSSVPTTVPATVPAASPSVVPSSTSARRTVKPTIKTKSKIVKLKLDRQHLVLLPPDNPLHARRTASPRPPISTHVSPPPGPAMAPPPRPGSKPGSKAASRQASPVVKAEPGSGLGTPALSPTVPSGDGTGKPKLKLKLKFNG
jgi:transcription initiation factor TFIID subunit 2